MSTILLLPLLLIIGNSPQEPVSQQEAPPVSVISFKWYKDRQSPENAVSMSMAPAPAITAASRNFEKQKRINSPAGERDPNADTLDTRGNELDRIVRESREAEPVEGFSYQMKVQNGSVKPAQNIFWEYQFTETANPANVTRRQFICNAKIKPGQAKELTAFTLIGPAGVINVKSLARDPGTQFKGVAIINRVEYGDGTFWQRPDWALDETKLNPRARAQTRNLPTCRSS
jgi:hypothetical protein